MNDFRNSLMAFAAVAALHCASVGAQNFPTKPVRVIVPLAPGGATDIQARLFSQKLGQALGQSFLIENRAGAGGLIAFKQVQQAAPDGYTLLATTPTLTIMSALYEKSPYDPVNDYEPIVQLSTAPLALIVKRAFPAQTIKDYLAWVKSNPGKLNMALAGEGTIVHLAAIWTDEATGTKSTMVAYKGTGPVIQDLVGGQVDATYANIISVGPLLKAGKIGLLAVTSAQRSPNFPTVPTLAESGLNNYDVSAWHGWVAPKGTSRAVVGVLNTELNRIIKSEDVEKALSTEGVLTIGGSPDAFRKVLVAELVRWRELVKAAGLKPPSE